MTPRPLLLWLTALALPVLLAGIWMPPLRQAALLFNLVLLAAAVADWRLTPSLKLLRVSREVSAVLSVGTQNPVLLMVRNLSSLPRTVELHDEPPQPGVVEGLPLTLNLNSGQERSGRYTLLPHERGRTGFTAVHLRSPSRLGLWTFIERRELHSPVRILPDIRAVYRYDLMARKNRLAELGLKVYRLRGQGSEFERLREYRREDEPRQIDWKATSRTRQLISREFSVERNQNILVALDCGRSMLNESDGISYLDRALNAAIMLSYIALGQSDNVGFLAFSNRIERTVRPVRGKPAIQTLLQQSFDLEGRRETSDYGLAIEHLQRRFRKRSLVVLITHAIDEQHLETISQSLRGIRSPHLFLVVLLRDLGLSNLAGRIPETDVQAFQSAAAAELLTSIERKTLSLKTGGILTLSSLPDQLTADVINGYLDVKARHLM